MDNIRWDELLKPHVPRLDKDNFLTQIVKFGMFAEQFPLCFNSNLFAQKLVELDNFVTCTKNQTKPRNSSESTVLSTRKNDITRRILSLPNPETFLRLAKYMKENWDDILKYSESNKSLSPITYIHSYGENLNKILLNSENVREFYISKSSYIEGISNAIKASLGYKYRLKIDIANCYDSIYTHSVTWAICGKENAKRYLLTKEPLELTQKYEFSDRLDCFTRHLKNNETNGIVVGPFTSRIVSEIVLAAIDKELSNENFLFRRYVDDYRFYFKSEANIHESLPRIERILNKYSLRLNSLKTQIDKFPFEIISRIRSSFEDSFKKNGVFGVLNEASILYKQGEKGAYKYALKFIKNKKPEDNDFEVIMSTLINVVLMEPKYGRYIIEYFRKYMKEWNRQIIEELVNYELSNSMKNEQQEEALVFLQIIRELPIRISIENFELILKSNNDFAIIITLDIWKNMSEKIEGIDKHTKKIQKCISDLVNSLQGEQYCGSRWLLLYESKFHNLIDLSVIKVEERPFFNELIRHKVTFYESLKNDN